MYFHKKKNTLIENKINVMEKFLDKVILINDEKHTIEQIRFTPDIKNLLMKELEKIKIELESIKDEVLKNRYLKIFDKINHAHPIVETCQSYINNIQKGNAPTKTELKILLRYHHYVMNFFQEKPFWYDKNMDKAIIKIEKVFNTLLFQHQRESGTDDALETAKKIYRCIRFINQFGKKDDINRIVKSIFNYTHSYIDNLLTHTLSKDAFNDHLALIFSLSQNFPFLFDKKIKTLLFKLKKQDELSSNLDMEFIFLEIKNHISQLVNPFITEEEKVTFLKNSPFVS
ncbi:MAG: hypothetical protein LEGION0398_MBIBDBAK_01214 [Legionellaceae bacterium]